MVNYLIFATSLRKDSINKSLAKKIAQLLKEKNNNVDYINLEEFDFPNFSEDIEKPKKLQELKSHFKKAESIIIISPEYNSVYPGSFKNIIDWLSIREEGEEKLECFNNKIFGIGSVSPGSLGGIRMLPQLRTLLQNLGGIVMPTMISYSNYTKETTFENDRLKKFIEEIDSLSNKVKK